MIGGTITKKQASKKKKMHAMMKWEGRFNHYRKKMPIVKKVHDRMKIPIFEKRGKKNG